MQGHEKSWGFSHINRVSYLFSFGRDPETFCYSKAYYKWVHRCLRCLGLADMKSSNINATKTRKAKGEREMLAGAERRVPAKKVVADFPVQLFERTEQAARELSMNRSRLIRFAVEAFLRRRDRQKLERAIAESLGANAAADMELMEEFKHLDTDTAAL
jgi:hypothetical protein